MMKSCETVVIVDSVEDAVKFYTEKLGFDIVDLLADNGIGVHLCAARLRKGKSFIKFSVPQPDEFADFTFIKRCASRCVCVQIEMKKGLDKYFTRSQKRGVKVVKEPFDCLQMGSRVFSVKDPFGIKLIFTQPLENVGSVAHSYNLCGMVVTREQARDVQIIDEMVAHLRGFGILRRSAKKFAKLKIKEISEGARK